MTENKVECVVTVMVVIVREERLKLKRLFEIER